jgi:RNA polymerase sigma factor (sigma-70 family)
MAGRPEQLLRHIHRFVPRPESGPDSDASLLDRFVRCQDEDAFAALVARHGPMVLGVCRSVLANAHEADDAFQAVWLVLARKAATVKPPGRLAAWLHGVARRVALHALRGRVRRQHRETRACRTGPVPAQSDPLDQLTARELLQVLDEEIQRLPEAYRLPVILCCLEGRSQEEAARQLGWTVGSVKGRLERGRARLHSRLTRRGLALSAALAAGEVTRGVAAAALDPAVLRAVMAFATGKSAAGVGLSANALTLASGVLRGVGATRLVVPAGLCLMLGVAWAGVALRTPPAQAPAGETGPGARAPAAPADENPDRGEPARVDRHGDALPEGAVARLGTLRFRGVRGCLAFSPDGRLLAAAGGSAGEQITLFDRTTGRAVRRFGRGVTVNRLAFSPDSRRLVSSGNENRCRVWDTTSGAELLTIPGTQAAFTGDGKSLVSADGFGARSQVHVCDAAKGRPLRQWLVENGVSDLVLAADAPVMAVVDRAEPAVIRVRDVTSGEIRSTLRLGREPRGGIAFAPDGKALATADQDGVHLWDVVTGKETRHFKQRADSRPVFSADGKSLAWTGYDERRGIGYVWVVERDGAAPRSVGGPVNNFEAPCLAPDGKVLAVVTDAHAIALREVATGKDAVSLDAHDSPVIGLALTADGRGVVSRGRTGVFAWDIASGRLLRRSVLDDIYGEYLEALLPDGRLLTAERPAKCFRVREAQTGRELLRIKGRPDVGEQVVGPGGRCAALRGPDGEVCVLDLESGRCRYRLDPTLAAFGLRVSADGNVLVWYRRLPAGFEVCVRRHTTGKTTVLPVLPQDDSLARWLDSGRGVSPNGRWLVLPTRDGRLRRWDLATDKELPPLPNSQRIVWGLYWSGDGQLMAARGVAAEPGVIDHEARQDLRLWDVAAGQRLAHLEVVNAQESVCFSPDGRTLLTTDLEGVIHLWEVATGQERHRLAGHLPGEIGALAMSADGRTLASGGYDSQVLVWDLTGGLGRAARPGPEQLRGAWERLRGADPQAAYLAMWALASSDAATAFLRERLRPVARPSFERVRRLIAELDHKEFAVRERAEHELEDLGEVADTDLRQALPRAPSAEARRRLRDLIEAIEQRVPSGKQLQALRGIEVLEHIGTPEARLLLRELAEGAPEARLTREAKASLQRLSQSAAATP